MSRKVPQMNLKIKQPQVSKHENAWTPGRKIANLSVGGKTSSNQVRLAEAENAQPLRDTLVLKLRPLGLRYHKASSLAQAQWNMLIKKSLGTRQQAQRQNVSNPLLQD